jgi:hypothetical protein
MANPASLSDEPKPSPDQLLQGLEGVAAARKRGPAPVHLWNPPFCGDIDMRIAGDGTWFYMGSPIGRAPLVQLFAFLAVELLTAHANGAPVLTFRTNVDDFVTVDRDHPLRFERGASEGLKPYVLVRGGLWALVKRALFYDLAALGERSDWQGENWFGVRSSGIFFPMTKASELEGL